MAITAGGNVVPSQSWLSDAPLGYMLTDDWSAANVNNESMKEFAEFYKTIRNSKGNILEVFLILISIRNQWLI